MFHVIHGLQCHNHDDQVQNARAPWWVQLLSVQLLSVHLLSLQLLSLQLLSLQL